MRIAANELDANAAHRLLKACIAPRPIAWVSTVDEQGRPNLAPYSCFTFVALDPPTIALSFELRADGSPKDTLRNIELTRQFVVHPVPEVLVEPMNATAQDLPPGESEFAHVGVETTPSEQVKPPRVARAPIAMECVAVDLREVGRSKHTLLLGEVVLFQMDDAVVRDGVPDPRLWRPVARLDGNAYTGLGDVVELPRPWLRRDG